MILTNLTNYVKNVALVSGNGLMYTGSNNQASQVTGLYPVTDCKGNVITTCYRGTYSSQSIFAPFSYTIANLSSTTTQTSNSSANYYTTYFGLGSGTTPVTETDIILENMISGYSVVSGETKLTNTVTISEDKKTITRVAKVSIAVKNSNTANLTISEVGLYQSMGTTNYTLLHREVLTEPIVIKTGEIATIQLEFTFVNNIA